MGQVTPTMLTAPLEAQRAAYDGLALLHPAPDDVVVLEEEAGGVPYERVVAPGADPDAVVLHLHGGGYGIGSPAGYRGLAARLSAASGAAVLVPDYRLAPEHPFPAALEDAARAYRWLTHEAPPPGGMALSGDSAGAGLALALLAELRSRGEALPEACVLWSPWADLAVADERAEGVEDPVLTVEWLQARAAAYLAGADPADPRASPVHAELSGLPPMLVLVGTDEILLPDARRVAERARAGGVDVTLVEAEGAVHLWMLLAPEAPESLAALATSGRFLSDRLAQPARRSI